MYITIQFNAIKKLDYINHDFTYVSRYYLINISVLFVHTLFVKIMHNYAVFLAYSYVSNLWIGSSTGGLCLGNTAWWLDLEKGRGWG